MSPIEHYFENLLTMDSDIKGEPNKNALSREVQEAVEICADYIKHNQLYRNAIPDDNNADMIDMLTELKSEIEEKATDLCDDGWWLTYNDIIQEKIDKLKENNDV